MAIEDLKVGDIVLSRDEFDSGAAVAGRRVEAVFVRRAVVMSIGVGGRIIETTEEHPFWVVGKGWTAANAMRVGDRVLTATGEPLRIESVGEARREATVYNFRVEEWHTYFVGDPITWGFDVWVHNNHVAQAGSVRSQHYSQSPTGTRLHKEAQSYRALHPDGANQRRNFATADVTVDGVQKTVRFKNDPGGMHSEQRLLSWEQAMKNRGRKVVVNGVYSERTPCGPRSANCADTLGNRFGRHLDVWHGDR